MKKTILITGATSGFGKAIAQLFAAQCYHLIITGRRSGRLNILKSELENQAASVTTLCFDVREKEAVKEALLSIQDRTIDILVNNAGLASGMSPIDEGNISDWDLMIDTNIKGLLYVTKETLPLLRKSKTPHIFNIGSTAGKTAYRNGNVYCATKFAVDALSQSMRIDLLPYGVKVTAINPGMAETEFSIVRFKGDEERAKNVYKDIKPLYAEDIANVVLFCATLPEHVCINDLTLTCTNQANAIYTIRDSEKPKQL
ncbi:MAG: SDR family NAD(P)-dependent oxidoreductase [Bacteroidetes bacterium]|nr:SDR family NAD(P)-dependent oxidoreductase [Bacteroidota bacterium]MBS1738921.1 SDR family NAD(P)-dependent oxidoreductase [Bacteroidota bacterium]MBS1776566.1 SDR family NAD(P)-dependent oxidoreductase [Bacteroidota bacterium]